MFVYKAREFSKKIDCVFLDDIRHWHCSLWKTQPLAHTSTGCGLNLDRLIGCT